MTEKIGGSRPSGVRGPGPKPKAEPKTSFADKLAQATTPVTRRAGYGNGGMAPRPNLGRGGAAPTAADDPAIAEAEQALGENMIATAAGVKGGQIEKEKAEGGMEGDED